MAAAFTLPPNRLPIVAWAALAAVCIVFAATAQFGWSEDGMHWVVRMSAKFGVVCFSLAFGASSLRIFWRSPASAWLLRNRRYMGLSFALFHFLHLGALAALTLTFPAFREGLRIGTLVAGGIVYGFVAAQTLTSNDYSVRLLGRRRWTLLHTVGSYAIWGAFTEVYAPLTFKHPGDAPFLAFLIAALGLRAARRIRSMRRST